MAEENKKPVQVFFRFDPIYKNTFCNKCKTGAVDCPVLKGLDGFNIKYRIFREEPNKIKVIDVTPFSYNLTTQYLARVAEHICWNCPNKQY